jgi:hypothetical protein
LLRGISAASYKPASGSNLPDCSTGFDNAHHAES